MGHPLLQAVGTAGTKAAQPCGDVVHQRRQTGQDLRQPFHQVGGLPDQLADQYGAQRDHQRQQCQCDHRRQKAALEVHLSPPQQDHRFHQRREAQRQQKGQQPHQRVAQDQPAYRQHCRGVCCFKKKCFLPLVQMITCLSIFSCKKGRDVLP